MPPRNLFLASLGLALLIPVIAFVSYRGLVTRPEVPSTNANGATGELAESAVQPLSVQAIPPVAARAPTAGANRSQHAPKDAAALGANAGKVVSEFTDSVPAILADAKSFAFADAYAALQLHKRKLQALETPVALSALASIAQYQEMIKSVESGFEATRKAEVDLQDLEIGEHASSGVTRLKNIAESLRSQIKVRTSAAEVEPTFVQWTAAAHERIRRVADLLDPELQMLKQVDPIVSTESPDSPGRVQDELTLVADRCAQALIRVKAKLRRSARFVFFFGGKSGGLGKAAKTPRVYSADELRTAEKVCETARINVVLWPSKDAQIEEEWTCRRDESRVEIVAPTVGRRETYGTFDPGAWFRDEADCWSGHDVDHKMFAICLTGDYGSAIFARCEHQTIDAKKVLNSSFKFQLIESVAGEDLAMDSMVVEIDNVEVKQVETDRWLHIPANLMTDIHRSVTRSLVSISNGTVSKAAIAKYIDGKGAAITIEGESLVMMMKPSIHQLKQEQRELDAIFEDEFRVEFGNFPAGVKALQKKTLLDDRIALLIRQIAATQKRISQLQRQYADSGDSQVRARIKAQINQLKEYLRNLKLRKQICEKLLSDWIPSCFVTDYRDQFATAAMREHASVVSGDIGVNLFDNFGVKSGHFVPLIHLKSDY